MIKFPARTRVAITRGINAVVDPTYFDNIGEFVSLVDEVLRGNGYRLVNEDFSDLWVIFCDDDGHALLRIAPLSRDELLNCGIALSWHRMPSGRYEIISYLT